MRLHGSLTRKHFLAQLKRQQWRGRRRKTPQNNNKQGRNTAARSDKYLSPRLNKSSRGVEGGGLVVKKIFQPFYPCCRHPNSFCQPLSHIIYKAGRQTIDLASFLHSISWLWHWQGRSGEECRMGESTWKRRKRRKVVKERQREGRGMRDEGWNILLKFSTRAPGSCQPVGDLYQKYVFSTTRGRMWGWDFNRVSSCFLEGWLGSSNHFTEVCVINQMNTHMQRKDNCYCWILHLWCPPKMVSCYPMRHVSIHRGITSWRLNPMNLFSWLYQL